MVARVALALIVLAALCAGILLGAYMLKPQLGPYPNYEPKVQLEYLYIRIFNTTLATGNAGSKDVTMVSFIAIVKVVNPYNDTDILPSAVAVHIPQDVNYKESAGSKVTFTATVSISGQPASGGSPPNNSTEVLKGGDGFAYGFTNDLILSHGVVHFSLRDINSIIQHDSTAYITISGTVPLPEIWSKNVRTWFHESSKGLWTYVVVSIDGKALGNNLEAKGTSDYVLILKVRLTRQGNEYWYGSVPKPVLDNPSDILVVVPKGVAP